MGTWAGPPRCRLRPNGCLARTTSHCIGSPRLWPLAAAGSTLARTTSHCCIGAPGLWPLAAAGSTLARTTSRCIGAPGLWPLAAAGSTLNLPTPPPTVPLATASGRTPQRTRCTHSMPGLCCCSLRQVCRFHYGFVGSSPLSISPLSVASRLLPSQSMPWYRRMCRGDPGTQLVADLRWTGLGLGAQRITLGRTNWQSR